MPGGADRSPRVAIIGAGMSGLLMAIKLRAAGIDDFVLFEKETEVGGTWRENIAELQVGYVMQCIFRWQAGDFDSIPYEESVELRAPLCPGGSAVPLIGRSSLRETWWAPLPDLVSGVEVIGTYVNEDLSAGTVEFLCHIKAF